jgi:hypothetical protein
VADVNHVRLFISELSGGGKDFDVSMVEEFRMTGCAQYFGKDLTTVDGVVGVIYFDSSFASVLFAFGLVESFHLRLKIIVSVGYFESYFVVGAIPCYQILTARKEYF